MMAKMYVVSESNLVFLDENDDPVVQFKIGNNSFYKQSIPSLIR